MLTLGLKYVIIRHNKELSNTKNTQIRRFKMSSFVDLTVMYVKINIDQKNELVITSNREVINALIELKRDCPKWFNKAVYMISEL